MKILHKLPLGPICMACLLGLNATHVVVHGTPLDSGAMDAFFVQANVFLSANLNTR
jgi:hypothetical protein